MPLIEGWEPHLNLTTWFALAGTIDPRAPKGWWPDALATRTLENSPSLQVSLLLASLEETSKGSLLDASAETAVPGWDESEREG